MSGSAGGTQPIRLLDVALSCAVLFALGVAQPLLDLLGRNAEFFLARAAPSGDIIALGVLLALITPLAIGSIVVAVYRLNATAGETVHLFVMIMLASVLVHQVLRRTPLDAMPGWLQIALSLAAAGFIAKAFYRSEALRSAYRFASIAPVVVLALFLGASSTSQLVWAAPAIAQPAQVPIGNPAPVVMVVFDEFPVASLIDGDGNLQEDVYPNFARLARDGTFYNNATTVQQQTERAMPAILTGTDPGDSDRIPTANDYPANLFTLLSDRYDLDVIEAVTELCPEFACENSSRPVLSASARWELLADDVRIVAGHVLLPADYTDSLPPIDQNWSNFAATTGAEEFDIIARFQELEGADRRIPIARFLDGIEPADGEAPLHFLHALVPHVPWTYLRSGQTYAAPSPAPGSVSPGWGEDDWLVDMAYQQHLIQVTYVDTVVGDLIDRLETAGWYDDALVVVLADHGITVRPGVEHRRVAYDDTIGDIAAVPLFIKLPNDPGGAVDSYRAETVDILPTIADVLDVDIPWDVDGTSLIAGDRPERTQSQITGDQGVKTFGTTGSEARAIAARKIDRFGTGGPFGLAPEGLADLLGTSVAGMDAEASSIFATVRDRTAFGNVDLDAPSLPARVRGVLTGDVPAGDFVVAVALNGSVAAVTRTETTDDGVVEFAAMLNPDQFVPGANEVELFFVDTSSGARVLRAISF